MPENYFAKRSLCAVVRRRDSGVVKYLPVFPITIIIHYLYSMVRYHRWRQLLFTDNSGHPIVRV